MLQASFTVVHGHSNLWPPGSESCMQLNGLHFAHMVRVSLLLHSPVFPKSMQAATHEVIHNVIATSHIVENLAHQRLLLLPLDYAEACVNPRHRMACCM